jgi:hypothetical protein
MTLSKSQPYPGLRPFDSGDEGYFFGREAQTRSLRARLDGSRLLAVVGRSGCGKSSLVRAGLVPLLQQEKTNDGAKVWYVASFRPQGRPITELAAELYRLTSESRQASAQAPADEARLAPAAEPAPDSATNSEEIAQLLESLQQRGGAVAELASQLRQLTSGTKDSPAAGGTTLEVPVGRQDDDDGVKCEDMERLRRSRLEAMLRRTSRGLVEAAGEINVPFSAQILIIVDQFEEIFRFEDPEGGNTDEATAFVRLLTEAINDERSKIRILLTMRLDFLGDCARFPRLPEAISEGQFLVPNLSRAERRAAIEEPARKAGKLIRPEVTQRLLNEIGDDPDQLPVLQHVLMRMWQQAGSGTEVTLKHYEDTGGVTGAISRHADQIYTGLPGDAHRKAAMRLFKAISERDRRGRSIRRATPFAEIAAIVASDAEKPSANASPSILTQVIDAYRAPDCCFLMPADGEELAADTRIDISHESLLRGWTRLTGQAAGDGWINEEDRDGHTYESLLEAAETRSTLSVEIARQRQKWWRTTQPNSAWAERYGGKFAEVERFVKTSAIRAFGLRYSLLALIVVTLTFGLWALLDEAKKKAEQAALTDKFSELTAQNDQINQQLNNILRDKRELEQRIRREQTKIPQSDQKTQQELDTLLQRNSSGPDVVVQRPGPGANVETLSSNTGYLWLGSTQSGNLVTQTGEPVLPATVKPNTQYLTTQDIYLREGAPDSTTYSQKPILGILPEGTLVQILNKTTAFARSGTDQYWAQVRVVKLALSTIYILYSSGSGDTAQRVSKALRDKGYKILGEERSNQAAGKHEVRYFYAAQKTLAQQLATTTNQILQQLGLTQLPAVTAESSGASSRNNPDGRLELWLETPSK